MRFTKHLKIWHQIILYNYCDIFASAFYFHHYFNYFCLFSQQLLFFMKIPLDLAYKILALILLLFCKIQKNLSKVKSWRDRWRTGTKSFYDCNIFGWNGLSYYKPYNNFMKETRSNWIEQDHMQLIYTSYWRQKK